MKLNEYIFSAAALVLSVCGCSRASGTDETADDLNPQFLSIEALPEGGYSLVSISPFDGSRDTLAVKRPMNRLIVMSTSYIGFLDAVDGCSAVVGVSGIEYVCDSAIASRAARGEVADVGFDASPDYEKILALKPDLLLTYSVSPVKSRFLSKLESLGIRVFIVNEHLERHPVARAAYVRLFGALVGDMAVADSVLSAVTQRYCSVRDSVRMSASRKKAKTASGRKVLVNIPYNDQWFIPGQENYLSNLVKDAGGEILGSEPGKAASSTVSIERAYSLAKDADLWLNVGWCRTADDLVSANPLFADFLARIKDNAAGRGYSGKVVWNDDKRLNAKGGNDFWESGVVHPDILLEDLIAVFGADGTEEKETSYFRAVE